MDFKKTTDKAIKLSDAIPNEIIREVNKGYSNLNGAISNFYMAAEMARQAGEDNFSKKVQSFADKLKEVKM